MVLRLNRQVIMAAAAAVLMLCLSAQAADAPDIRSEVRKATGNVRDICWETRVIKRDQAVLKKMGKRYVQQFEIDKVLSYFKMPDLYRVEGKLGLVKVQVIMRGSQRIFRIPSLRLTKKDDISEDQRSQSCLDLGLLCDSAWDDSDVKFVRTEEWDSGSVYVLDFVRRWKYPKTFRTFVDKKTLRILRMEKRNDHGILQAVFVFPEAKLVDGVIWFPTRIELHSPDGEVAAVTESTNLRANVGLKDEFFQ